MADKNLKTIKNPVVSKSAKAAKTTSANVTVKRTAKSRKKTADVPAEMTFVDQSKIRSRFPISKKTTYTILLALGVVVLLFAANKYLVVAWVDKQPVTAFEYYSTLSKRYGNDISDELIVQKLLQSEANQKNIKISDQELNDEIKRIQDQQGGADKLNQILQAQNISQDEFKRLVKLQLLRSKLFSNEGQVTEAEVDAYIAENKDAFAAGSGTSGAETDPKSDPKLRDSIKEQLKQQKINASFSAWLQDARKGTRVVKNWQ